MSEITPFEVFKDEDADEIRLFLPPDRAKYIDDTLGVFPARVDTMELQTKQFAHTGASVMMAALHAKRGPTSENIEIIQQVQTAVSEGQLPTVYRSNASSKSSLGGDVFTWRYQPIDGNFDDEHLLDQAYFTGARLLTLGMIAGDFINHPQTGKSQDGSYSKADLVHMDTYYERYVSSDEARDTLREILNTYAAHTITLAGHSYDGRYDRKLCFAALTEFEGFSVAADVTASRSQSRGDDIIRLDSNSSHVRRRGNFVKVDRQYANFGDTVCKITNSLNASLTKNSK